MSYMTQSRSFQRRSSQPITWLILTNKTVQEKTQTTKTTTQKSKQHISVFDYMRRRQPLKSTFRTPWPWPWPWIGSRGIPSCITHRCLPMYQISFKSEKLFVDGQTYGHTDGRMDIETDFIRSTWSQPIYCH